MKYFLLFVLVILIVRTEGNDKIKVACVGNSITYGHGIENREKNSYPGQLQSLLGKTYDVRNFGVSGTTLLSKGDYPYVRTQSYKNALDFRPDIVFIKLGTNDSKSQNRIYLNEFKYDYEKLIQEFRSSNPAVRIVLLTPIPAFTQPDTMGITDDVITRRIIPLLEKTAYETGVEILHLYPLFVDCDERVIPDKIHPSVIGAEMIARRIHEHILQPRHDMNILTDLNVKGVESNFYGYQCTDFDYKGVSCKIVSPKKAAAGNPWIWRARFWGHEPQTDIALLDRGFHLAYCDVADLFGAPSAVKRWNDFHQLMMKGHLNKKVVLEGMSRGGLIIYNWAVENPQKVACVYADAPVLDLKSWPMGIGTKKPDSQAVKAMLKAYGWQSEKEAGAYEKNPLNRAEKIAGAGFRMLHVCGEIDDVVPVRENTDPFAEKVLKSGGKIEVIRKPGVNHHPHSLKNPGIIVDFILQSIVE